MNNFWRRYLVYLLIFFGGFMIGLFDWWIEWVGCVMALSGYWLLTKWAPSNETN